MSTAGVYRAPLVPQAQLAKRPPPGPPWPLPASFARLAWAWFTGRLRRLGDRRIRRMLPSMAHELGEASERVRHRVARLRPNLEAEIRAQRREEWLVRLGKWNRSGRLGAKPLPLPLPPKQISM